MSIQNPSTHVCTCIGDCQLDPVPTSSFHSGLLALHAGVLNSIRIPVGHLLLPSTHLGVLSSTTNIFTTTSFGYLVSGLSSFLRARLTGMYSRKSQLVVGNIKGLVAEDISMSPSRPHDRYVCVLSISWRHCCARSFNSHVDCLCRCQ